jgi:hypothetical protein
MVSTPAYVPSPDEIRAAVAAPWQWDGIWQIAGLCRRDSDRDWYPDSASSQRRLTRICQGCPVRRQCLTWALETGEHAGVWGGLTERELRKTAGITPQGTKRTRPSTNICCPWCTSRNLLMVATERIKCETCGFDWPGMVADRCDLIDTNSN